jgi:hypothetical protein
MHIIYDGVYRQIQSFRFLAKAIHKKPFKTNLK